MYETLVDESVETRFDVRVNAPKTLQLTTKALSMT